MRLKMLFTILTIGLSYTVFGQNYNPDAKPFETRYYHPFKDKSFMLVLEYFLVDLDSVGSNTIISFKQKRNNGVHLFWQETMQLTFIENNIEFEDYNNDGVKDLVLFSQTGARGGNAFYHLYLIDQQKHTLTKIRGFNDIVNPSYNKKHHIILSYGLAGSNYYSIYKLAKNNTLHKIGESFEDTGTMDDDMLDKKISKILSQNK